VSVTRAALAAVRGGIVVLAMTVPCGTAVAADATKERCVDANTKAQSLRRQGRFAEARDALRVCGAAACPSIVRDDCAERLDALDRAQPTMVLDVKDANGNDLTTVKLTVDGRVVADPLGGTPVALDPGEHSFLIESPGHAPLTRTFVLKEGEKGRREKILLAVPQSAPRSAVAEEPADRPAQVLPPAGGLGAQKTLALVVAGLGVASIATGAVLGFGASSAYRDQQRDCGSPTDCINHAQAVSDHSTMETEGTWSTVAFVSGGVLLAGGAWLFFTDRGVPAKAAGFVVAPAAGRTGTGLLVRGEF
jgi:hypothetical protein